MCRTLKITPSVNFTSSRAGIKQPLHIQKQGTNTCVRPQYYYITTTLPPGQTALGFLCSEAGSSVSSPGSHLQDDHEGGLWE